MDDSKLQDNFFPTISTPPKKLRAGHKCIIKTPSQKFKVIFVRSNSDHIREIETYDLTEATDTQSRKEALNVLRQFFPDLGENSLVQVLWFVPEMMEE